MGFRRIGHNEKMNTPKALCIGKLFKAVYKTSIHVKNIATLCSFRCQQYKMIKYTTDGQY